MSTLRIFISDVPIKTDTYYWVLFDAAGHVLRQGQDSLNSLPLADQTEVVIPADWVSLIPVKLPSGNRKRISEALPYLIEDYLITSPEQVHVVIAETLNDQYAILASVDKEKLGDLIKSLSNKHIQANRIFPATLCTRPPKDAWVMVCDSHHSFVRTADSAGFAFEVDYPTDDPAPPLALQLAIKQTGSKIPEEILVYGATPHHLDSWSTQLGVHFSAQSADWRTTPPSPGMNFLQGAFEPVGKSWVAINQVRPAILLFFAIILTAIIGSSVDWARKAMENRRLDNEMNALFMRTFPDTNNVVDAALQMQRKLAEMQHTSGESDSGDFLPLLANLTSRTGGLANLKALDYQNEQLSLTLQASNEQAAQELAQKITIPSRIIVIENLKRNNDNVEYDLVLKADGE